jgi:hypothetical protein
MFDAGSPLPGLLLALMLFLTLILLPYTDDTRARTRDDEPTPEELRLRAEAIARTRDGGQSPKKQRRM